MTWFFENDNREENYQNRVLIPFLETLCTGFDVVDTSMLTKEWDERGIENCASHSRYFSDELDAQNFYQNGNKCLSYSYAYGILFL